MRGSSISRCRQRSRGRAAAARLLLERRDDRLPEELDPPLRAPPYNVDLGQERDGSALPENRIDLRTGRLIARLHVGGTPVRLGVGFGSIWVDDDNGRVLRIRPTG